MRYRSICGCLLSEPEPSPAEYETHEQYQAAWDQWDSTWKQAVEDHSPYACLQERCEREGWDD